jgi:hypothetical protein
MIYSHPSASVAPVAVVTEAAKLPLLQRMQLKLVLRSEPWVPLVAVLFRLLGLLQAELFAAQQVY